MYIYIILFLSEYIVLCIYIYVGYVLVMFGYCCALVTLWLHFGDWVAFWLHFGYVLVIFKDIWGALGLCSGYVRLLVVAFWLGFGCFLALRLTRVFYFLVMFCRLGTSCVRLKEWRLTGGGTRRDSWTLARGLVNSRFFLVFRWKYRPSTGPLASSANCSGVKFVQTLLFGHGHFESSALSKSGKTSEP